MQPLDSLLRYVRTGTAEGDKSFLDQVFIAPTQLDQLVGIEPGGMRLLVGSKGTGKSAMVEWLESIAQKRELPCLLLRPDNLELSGMSPNAADIATLKRQFFEALVSAVAVQIGGRLSGMLVGDAAALYRAAQKAGVASKDWVQKTLAVVSALAVPASKVDGIALAKELINVDPALGVLRAVKGHLLESGSVFFLLIDDTDQVASPSSAAQLNRIWALLLAVRRLASECPSIRAIVTLRAEVWSRLISESQGQRDQADHLRNLVVLLSVENSQIAGIIERRLAQAARDLGHPLQGDLYPVFFIGHGVETAQYHLDNWQEFILKCARSRPRDAIQLIRNMIDRAKIHKSPRIGSAEGDEGVKVYSKERIDDLYNEFSPDCSVVRHIIDSFYGLSTHTFLYDDLHHRKIAFEELRAHLRTVPSRFPVELRGRTLRPQDDEDAMLLLAFLHETGFIHPVVTTAQGLRLPVLFGDNPSFCMPANWNQMQVATWDIHDAFRPYFREMLVKAPPKFKNAERPSRRG